MLCSTLLNFIYWIYIGIYNIKSQNMDETISFEFINLVCKCDFKFFVQNMQVGQERYNKQ